jgi:hypothetical protein
MKHNICWNNINIEIDYNPSYSISIREIYGYELAHVQVRAVQALPVTETGYLSYFTCTSEVEAQGGVIDLVILALNQEAKKAAWKKHEEELAQLKLF